MRESVLPQSVFDRLRAMAPPRKPEVKKPAVRTKERVKKAVKEKKPRVRLPVVRAKMGPLNELKCLNVYCSKVFQPTLQRPHRVYCSEQCRKRGENGRLKCVKRIRARDYIRTIKVKQAVCSHCGLPTLPYNMDCHHRDAEDKLFNLSRPPTGISFAQIDAELEKCDFLCKLCHGKATYDPVAFFTERIRNIGLEIAADLSMAGG